MKIHYFQRYHQKENVATANAMLMLSRLYQYSADKFFRLLKSELFSDSFEPEIVFNLQEKSVDSVPDATITQQSFKVVVETKTSDWFYSDQLMRHLNSFSDEKYKVLMTLAPVPMNEETKNDFESKLQKYNEEQQNPIAHINTTFELLAKAIQDVIDDRDYEMQEVLDDFLSYCYEDGLIPVADSWKYMRVQLAGQTFDFNTSHNVYYDNADRSFRAHDYLGLYTNKSVRAIGKVIARITAIEENGEMHYEVEYGDLTDERKAEIKAAILDGDSHGYNLRPYKHRYFFVEKFYETDFKKSTKYAPMGSRVFDLTEILDTNVIPESVEKIANILQKKTWQ